jgi:hypothetical protein
MDELGTAKTFYEQVNRLPSYSYCFHTISSAITVISMDVIGYARAY